LESLIHFNLDDSDSEKQLEFTLKTDSVIFMADPLKLILPKELF